MPYKDAEKQRQAVREAVTRYYKRNGYEKQREWQRKSRGKTRGLVLQFYGGGKQACVICEESRQACLSIDHINGGGCAHRNNLGLKSGTAFYRWLKKNNFPNGYQTLCMNCQFIKKRAEARDGKHTKPDGNLIPDF